MTPKTPGRRRSDAREFIQTDVDIDAIAREIFGRYAGTQRVVIDGVPSAATFFDPGYCPDFRVMTLAGRLALAVNRRAVHGGEHAGITPLRVSIEELMLAALLHDVGKHHEDCVPLLELMRTTDLRRGEDEAAARKAYLLGIVRDVHCRKGPCMLDRLRDAGRAELNNPFIATVARRHGDDYASNRGMGRWWAREINVVTIADDFDAMTSPGPERAYKRANLTADEAAALLRAGSAAGRYEPRLVDVFLSDVLGAAPD